MSIEVQSQLADALFHVCKVEQVLRWAAQQMMKRDEHQIQDTNNLIAGLAHVYECQKSLKKCMAMDKERDDR